MNCPSCKHEISDENIDICPECGFNLSMEQADTDKLNIDAVNRNKKRKVSGKKRLLIGAAFISIILLAIIVINYRWIFYEINMISANGTQNTDKKIEYCVIAINYRAGNSGVKLFTELVGKEIDSDPVKAQGQLLQVKGKINNDEFKKLMIQALVKRAENDSNDNIKVSLDSFLEARKYGYDLAKDNNFKEELNKYAQQNLANSDPDGFKIVSVDSGDIDNNGSFEVILGELPSNNLSSSDYYGYGRIYAYRYDGSKFVYLDKTDVFADSSISITIGKASKSVTGIFVQSVIGAHSGSTQLLLLKNNHLIYPVNNLGIYSLYPIKVRDVDNNGILEIGSMDINPKSKDKSNAGSDKIIIYYKWDGGTKFNVVKKVYQTGSTSENQ